MRYTETADHALIGRPWNPEPVVLDPTAGMLWCSIDPHESIGDLADRIGARSPRERIEVLDAVRLLRANGAVVEADHPAAARGADDPLGAAVHPVTFAGATVEDGWLVLSADTPGEVTVIVDDDERATDAAGRPIVGVRTVDGPINPATELRALRTVIAQLDEPSWTSVTAMDVVVAVVGLSPPPPVPDADHPH